MFSGHQGIARTLDRYFHWHGLAEDFCRAFSSTFVGHVGRKRRLPKAPLQSYIAGAPMDRIQIDLLGPLPESTSRNKYVLVIIDQFSKWVQAYALPHQGSELVAEKLVKEFIAVFVVSLELHSDQGSSFQSELFKELCRPLQILQTKATPYHPTSNGQVERLTGCFRWSAVAWMLDKPVGRTSAITFGSLSQYPSSSYRIHP